MDWDDDASMISCRDSPATSRNLDGMAFGMSNGIHCIDHPIFFASVKCR